MWSHVLSLCPALLSNRMQRGRYLDIFVTHSPPWQINDETDRAHRGIKAFRWLLRVFQPPYHFHGHVHTYVPSAVVETRFHKTRVINAYGHRRMTIQL